MFDPFDMFCGGPPNAIGLQIMEESDRAARIETIIRFLKTYKQATLKGACELYGINYNGLTDAEKTHIRSHIPGIK